MRVAVVDDEPLARQAMRHLLAVHPTVEIVAEAATVEQARQVLAAHRPDVVFLDVQLPGADGFSLLQGLESSPQIVFVTAHSRHAVQAFAVHAADYLLKPVRPERLAETLARIEAMLLRDAPAEPRERPVEAVTFRTPQRTLVAPLERLVAIEAEGDFVRVFVEGEMPLLVCQTLRSSAESLPPSTFAAVGRSLVINLSRVSAVERSGQGRGSLRMTGVETPFALGRAAARRLRELLGKRAE